MNSLSRAISSSNAGETRGCILPRLVVCLSESQRMLHHLEGRGERTGRTTVAWDFAIWTTAIERDAANSAYIVIIIVVVFVVLLLFLLAGVVVVTLSLIESGRGGFQVPLPGRDGVVVVDRDLHRGSIAWTSLATYYQLSTGCSREGERDERPPRFSHLLIVNDPPTWSLE